MKIMHVAEAVIVIPIILRGEAMMFSHLNE
jgi:hypothetical protein